MPPDGEIARAAELLFNRLPRLLQDPRSSALICGKVWLLVFPISFISGNQWCGSWFSDLPLRSFVSFVVKVFLLFPDHPITGSPDYPISESVSSVLISGKLF
jgi:hypothetical protein